MDGEGCWDQIHSVCCSWPQWEGLQDSAVPWVHQIKTSPFQRRKTIIHEGLDILMMLWRLLEREHVQNFLMFWKNSITVPTGREGEVGENSILLKTSHWLHRKSLECKTKAEVLEGELWALPTEPTTGSFSLSCGGQWWSLFPAGFKLC